MLHIPRAGATWEIKIPGKRKVVKVIDYINFEWIYVSRDKDMRWPIAHFKRQPKGRYSSLRIKGLLKYGKLIKEART